MQTVFDDPNIPNIAKEKFYKDVLGKVRLFEKIELSDIQTLQNRRMIESLGLEYFDIQGKSQAQIQAFYLNKILHGTIEYYVTPVARSLSKSFGPRERNGSGEYNQREFDSFMKSIDTLDKKF